MGKETGNFRRIDGGAGRAIRLGLLLLAGALLSACSIRKGGTDPDETGGGIVITVTDSTKVSLNFDDTARVMFSDSGDLNLNSLRTKIADKDIDLETVNIRGLSVTYDEETRAFLENNAGLRFILRIYVRDVSSDTTKRRLTLESYVDPAKASKLDPGQTLFELNKHLFGKEEGMPFLLGAIKDTAVEKVRVIAELELIDKLKAPGDLNLNMVVDVEGKV